MTQPRPRPRLLGAGPRHRAAEQHTALTESEGGFVFAHRPRENGKMAEAAGALRHAARQQALAEAAEFIRPASYYQAKPHKAAGDIARLQEWLAGQGVEVTG